MSRFPYLARLLAALSAVAGAVLIAACSTPAPPASAGSSTSSMSMPSDSTGNTTAGQAPVATNAVTIKNFAFSPQTITVKAGSTVTWTNTDQDAHTVTSQGGGGPLRSPTLVNGASYRYTFSTPGHYDYLCTIHPFMTGTVVVTP